MDRWTEMQMYNDIIALHSCLANLAYLREEMPRVGAVGYREMESRLAAVGRGWWGRGAGCH